MDKKDFIKALVTAFITAIVALLFKYIDPPTILTEIWQRVFVGPWFLWLGAVAFWVYWVVRQIVKLHDRMSIVPILMTAVSDNMRETVKLVEQESKSRVSVDDSLSARLRNDLDREVSAVHGKLDELLRKEAHERADGINALIHQRQLDYERMNKIETSLPQQIYGRIQDGEKTVSAQVAAIKAKFDKVDAAIAELQAGKADRPPDASLLASVIKNSGLINTASQSKK